MTSASSSSEPNQPSPIQLISKYLDITTDPTFEDFIQKHRAQIREFMKPGVRLNDTWASWYATATKAKNIPYVLVNPDEPVSATSTSDGSVSSTIMAAESSSKMDSGSLENGIDKAKITCAAVEEIYKSLDVSNMWTLSTGKVVELTMKKFALECICEQPVHSLILDTDDPMWVDDGYFTKKEMDEIKQHNLPNDASLPNKISSYMNGYLGKCTLDTIFNHARQPPVNPLVEPDNYWIHQSFLRTLELFYHNHLPVSDHMNGYLLRRLWGIVEGCFDESKFSVRSGEAMNTDEEYPSYEAVTPLIKNAHLVIKYLEKEFGCIGSVESEADMIEEDFETNLMYQKTLRDMLAKLAAENPNNAQKIVTAGFLIKGLDIKCLVMNHPAGYVYRLQSLGPLAFPDSEFNLASRLISILATIWRVKQMLKDSLGMVLKRTNVFLPTFANPTEVSPKSPYREFKEPAFKRQRMDNDQRKRG